MLQLRRLSGSPPQEETPAIAARRWEPATRESTCAQSAMDLAVQAWPELPVARATRSSSSLASTLKAYLTKSPADRHGMRRSFSNVRCLALARSEPAIQRRSRSTLHRVTLRFGAS